MTDMMEQATGGQESRVRSLARRHGYKVRRSCRGWSIDNQGEFMLVDVDRNCIVLGEKYDATLEEIEQFFRGDAQ